MSKAGPRKPSYLRFVVTGTVVGLIVGSAIAIFGDSAPDYSGGTQRACSRSPSVSSAACSVAWPGYSSNAADRREWAAAWSIEPLTSQTGAARSDVAATVGE